MSDDYWKNRKKWDQIHGRGEYGQSKPTTTAQPVPQEKVPEPIAFATPQEEIAHLRDLLKAVWNLYVETMLLDKDVDKKPTRAFLAVDKKLRALGIVGPDNRTKK